MHSKDVEWVYPGSFLVISTLRSLTLFKYGSDWWSTDINKKDSLAMAFLFYALIKMNKTSKETMNRN